MSRTVVSFHDRSRQKPRRERCSKNEALKYLPSATLPSRMSHRFLTPIRLRLARGDNAVSAAAASTAAIDNSDRSIPRSSMAT